MVDSFSEALFGNILMAIDDGDVGSMIATQLHPVSLQ